MNEVSPRLQLDPNTHTRTTPKWSRTLRISDQNSAGVSHIFHMLFTRECQKCLNGRGRRSIKKRNFLHTELSPKYFARSKNCLNSSILLQVL